MGRSAITGTFVVSLFLATGCVQSNLDNAFDPQYPLGLAIGLNLLGSGGSDGSDSTASTSTPTVAATVCGRTTTFQSWGAYSQTANTAAGTYPVTVGSGAAQVQLLVIGGGGGGGSIDVARDGVTSTSLNGFNGSSSYWEINGGSTIITAGGGTGGTHSQGGNPTYAPAVVGPGGAGGSPGGVTGGNGPWASGSATVGQHSNYWAGQGGWGTPGGSFGGWTWYGGGSGGSGAMDSTTRTDLAGSNLNIVIGSGAAGGTSADGFSMTGSGSAGYGYLLESDLATSGDCAHSPALHLYGYAHNSAGTYSLSIPATAAKVEIVAVGGGGGGGTVDLARDGATSTQLDGFAGGDTTVAINGGATILTATGGQGGNTSFGSITTYAPAVQGTGGTGGTPSGNAGQDGPLNTGPSAGGSSPITNYQAGAGGGGSTAFAAFGGFYGGGGGGSGGTDTVTRTDLGGQTLDITIGAGGAAGTTVDGVTGQTAGTDGYVRVLIH